MLCCETEEETLYSQDCVECAEYEENLFAVRHVLDIKTMDIIPYDTVPIVVTLDTGLYCIGDLAFEINLDISDYNGYITIGPDTLYPTENVFLEMIDENLLNLMTQNGSCAFLEIESN